MNSSIWRWDQYQVPPLMLFSARSGSTPVARLLGEYLHQNHQISNLMEFFNPAQIVELDQNPPQFRGYNKELQKLDFQSRRKHPLFSAAALKKREAAYFSNDQKIFVKVSPSQVSEQFFNWMTSTHFVFLQFRKDYEAQVLSFFISYISRWWYESGGLRIEEESLMATEEAALAMTDHLRAFIKMSERVQDGRAIFLKTF